MPTRKDCLSLLKDTNCSENVIAHCKAVENLAIKIAKMTDANKELVSRGALIHDIGRGRTHGVKHAYEGAKIAKKLGLPDNIILIIERHIGAGLTKDEAKSVGLPAKDYIPITLEEKIVAHADNLIDENEKKPVAVVVKRFRKLGYNAAADKILALHKELSKICKKDLDSIK
ncbi:MAG: HDIG domain-containing protein [Thermoplasmata archaeon]|nr:MAG: HDIG domain-containing protein [Thermoplasmata archaeon]